MRRVHVNFDFWVSDHADAASRPRLLLAAFKFFQPVLPIDQLVINALVSVVNQSELVRYPCLPCPLRRGWRLLLLHVNVLKNSFVIQFSMLC
jgi:hypothetical protein